MNREKCNIYIFAGSMKQAEKFAAAEEIPPKRRRYINSLRDIRGVDRGSIVCLVGTYADRPDVLEYINEFHSRDFITISCSW